MRIGASSRHAKYVDEENPYWISFSDIMSGLLVLFILASLALMLELTKTKSDVSNEIKNLIKAEQVRKQVISDIKEKLDKNNIKVVVNEEQRIITIPSNILSFRSGEYKIPNENVRKIVLKIGEVLYEEISKDDRFKYLDTVFVEGHTDNRHFNEHAHGNWGLSASRANEIWLHWHRNLPESKKIETLRNHKGELLFSVSGYGESRPAQIEQNSAEERQKNRRIDIRFTIKRPGKDELQRILNQLGGDL